MEDLDRGSVSMWIDQLRGGDDDAAAMIWNRYFDKLLAVARRRLGGIPRRASDEEDVAASVFESLCRGADAGRFGEMRDRTDLWKLLVTITRQKAVDQIRRDKSQKRGRGEVRGESVFLGKNDDSRSAGMAEMFRVEPTPDFLVAMEEQNERLLSSLQDDALRQIAVLKLHGYSNNEIAQELDVATRTVERKLALIRSRWEKELNE